MNTISFMTANFVARQLNYHMTEGWGQGDTATQDYFRPLTTFEQRFDDLLHEIQIMGFTAIDLWGAHLNPAWATPEHIAIARDLLQKYGFAVSSAAFWITDVEYLERACQLMVALNIPLIGGGGSLIETDYAGMVRVLRHYNIQYGYENHPESSADEILAKIGDQDEDIIGIVLDTGWVGTHIGEAVATTKALLPRLKHIHLKDVRQVGGHDTCGYGDGIVNIQGVVVALQAGGYQGGYSVEHEPETYNPTEEVLASYAMLRGWLGV